MCDHTLEREDDDGDDEGMGAIGFMFDAEAKKSLRRFTVTRMNGDALELSLLCIDSPPGAVQSGHYIWPAASALAKYLAKHWGQDAQENEKVGLKLPGDECRVVELGAGAGLAGITAAHLGARRVVFTDHDAGVLGLIRENINSQDFSCSKRPQAVAKTNEACFLALPLAWGPQGKPWPVELEAMCDKNSGDNDGFDLVLCSDCIYDTGVVAPLLWTIRNLLSATNPQAVALLCGSFALELGTDDLIRQHGRELGLTFELVYDCLQSGGCRLHALRLSSP